MIRLIPKRGHEDWMVRLGKIASNEEIIDKLISSDDTDNEDLRHLRSLPYTYSDYHGIGQLDHPYFVIIHDTFPPLTEAKVLEFNKEKSQ